ncbi:MAG: TolB protein, partial [Frankiales bacterium]|nr:TolB protein [Frankiales bacterium]
MQTVPRMCLLTERDHGVTVRDVLMSRSFVRVLAGVTGTLVAAGVALAPLPAIAAAPATAAGVPKATALVTVKAHRLADVRVAAHGATSFKALGVAGVPASGVAAVVLKLTASKPGATGALVAWPNGAKRPSVLSVSFTRGRDATSVVVVTPGTKGRISVADLSSGAVRIIPTVVGYYRKATATSAALTYFRAVTPRQIASVRLAAGASVAVHAAGAHGVPATGTAGVVLELSALTPAKAGTFTVSPSGGTKSKVTALSFAAARNATNLVTAATGSKGRIVVTNRSKGVVRVRLDVVGYLVALAPVGGRPGAVTVTAHAVGVARLTWTAAKTDPGAPVLRYGVLVSQTLPKPATRTVYSTRPVTTLDVAGLADGVAYRFQVFAVTKEGRSASSPLSAPVVASVPLPPTAVTAVASAPGSVTVSWLPGAARGPAVTSYTISGAHSGPVTVGATVTSYTFTGQTTGQTLVATVTATNALGSSAPSAPSTAVIVPGPAGSNVTSAVSVDSAGAYHGSGVTTATPAVSADGRYVAFSSVASITGGDNAHRANVYLRDRTTGMTTLISTPSPGVFGNGDSTDVAMTPDGRYIAFDSFASNLVIGDTNGREDVFVFDRQAGTLSRVSLTDAGTEGDKASLLPAISGNGQYVAFISNSTNLIGAEINPAYNLYVRDLVNNTTARVSRAVGGDFPVGSNLSVPPSISNDGRLIGYTSDASNIVVGDSNGANDAFVYDQVAHTTSL